MLHRRVLERNPALIDAAIELQQTGRIPANSWLFDLDAVADNARMLSEEAGRLNLTTFFMTKQVARQPMVVRTALQHGLDKTVAVDVQCATILHRYGIPIGHVGHLNQIPRHDIDRVLLMRPEFWTVYSVDAARAISEAAVRQDIEQSLLLRVYAPGDVFFEGQEGGFRDAEVIDAARAISLLPNVSIVGVTSFPCIEYTFEAERMPPAPNPNLATITKAAKAIETQLDIRMRVINTPGNTSTETLQTLKDAGSTHVEPGHGILGTTLTQISTGTDFERPAYVYVSEISHIYEGKGYAFGGGIASLMTGFFGDDWSPQAFVGTTPDRAKNNPVDYHHIGQIIDYHLPLEEGDRCQVGDTVVLPIYTQAQMTRSYMVAVSGISSGDPKVMGMFDHAGTMLDESFMPVSTAAAVDLLDEMAGF